MGLSTRILIRICVVALVFAVVMEQLYRHSSTLQRLTVAEQQLLQAANTSASLIESRFEELQGQLGRLARGGDADLAVLETQTSPAAQQAAARARLEQQGQRLMQEHAQFQRIEIYAVSSSRCLLAVDGQQALSAPPRPVQPIWLSKAAASAGLVALQGDAEPGVVRIGVPLALPEAGEVVACGYVDCETAYLPLILASTLSTGPVGIQVKSQEGALLSQHGPGLEGQQVLAVASTPAVGGRIVLYRSREQALAGMADTERDLLAATALLIGLMAATLWLSLRRSVIVPVNRMMDVVEAFGQDLPIPALARRNRAKGELALLDMSLRDAVFAFRDTRMSLLQLNDQLEERVLDRTETLKQFCNSLEIAMEETRARCDLAESRLEDTAARLGDTEQELSTSRDSIRNLEDGLRTTEERLTELRQVAGETEALRAEQATLHQALQDGQAELAGAREAHRTVEAERQRLVQALPELTGRCEAEQARLERIDEEWAAAQARHERAKAEALAAEQRLDGLHQETTTATQRVDELRRTQAGLENVLAEHNMSLAALDDLCNDRCERADQLEHGLAAAQARLGKAQAESQTAERRLGELQQETNATAHRVDELRRTQAGLESLLDERNASLQALDEQCRLGGERAGQLEHELAAAQARLGRAEAEARTAEQRLDELRAESVQLADATAPAPSLHLAGLRVLATSARDDMRSALQHMLTEGGAQAEFVVDAETALVGACEAFERGDAFQLILIDTHLGERTVRELVRAFAADPALMATPLVMLGGTPTPGEALARLASPTCAANLTDKPRPAVAARPSTS